jgi:organic radical activating enzyme
MKGKISEVFESIQGEGIYLWKRQLFVRCFGCNLSCKFCDTKLDKFQEYTAEELFNTLKSFKNEFHSISFTGGEPLLQKDFLKEILPLTQRYGFKSYLETNGTLPEALGEVIDYLDIIAMDFKLPSSTGLNNFWDAHRKFLKIASRKYVFSKAVICHSTEQEDLEKVLELIEAVNRTTILILQPNSLEDDEHLKEKLKNYKDLCIQRGIITFIIPQMHKRLGIK